MRDGGYIYSLPTEAQWEYAAHAGDSVELPSNYKEMAWFIENSNDKTHEVGKTTPNRFGLYDMFGHVAEFVYDRYAHFEKGKHVVDPFFDPKDPEAVKAGFGTVSRGCDFGDTPCEYGRRFGLSSEEPASRGLGFRLVRKKK